MAMMAWSDALLHVLQAAESADQQLPHLLVAWEVCFQDLPVP